MKSACVVAAVLCSLLGAGCSNLFSNKTSPTSDPTKLTAGQWNSITSTTKLLDTCTNFHWTIADVSGTTGSGAFTATCLTNLQIAGTARGTLTDDQVAWTADAQGTTPAGADCPVALSGTATYDGTQFRLPFKGTTCLGPVSGAEVLRRP